MLYWFFASAAAWLYWTLLFIEQKLHFLEFLGSVVLSHIILSKMIRLDLSWTASRKKKPSASLPAADVSLCPCVFVAICYKLRDLEPMTRTRLAGTISAVIGWTLYTCASSWSCSVRGGEIIQSIMLGVPLQSLSAVFVRSFSLIRRVHGVCAQCLRWNTGCCEDRE